MNILIIGGGHMGFTYAKGVLDAELPNTTINILEHNVARRKFLQGYHFRLFERYENCLSDADMILFAVKPQKCVALFDEIKNAVSDRQIFISIMAGVSVAVIAKYLKVDKIVRAMPNLPAQLGKGMTGVFFSTTIQSNEQATVLKILATTGEVISLPKESDIDAITGVSGSGPAYVFYFMNAMIQAAIEMGFTKQDAKKMVAQTFRGAVAQFNASDDDLSTWINRVASKGGTTREALDVLDVEKVGAHIKKAVFAAKNRAVVLGKNTQ